MTGLEWVGQTMGAVAVDGIVDALKRKELGRDLVRRVGRHEDIKLRWVERLLLRRLVRQAETWPLLLDTRSTTHQELADAVERGVVLLPFPTRADRSRVIASALQAEVLGALEVDDAFVALSAKLDWAAQDIRDLLDRTRPRDPDPALDAFVELLEFYAPTLAPGRRFDHRAKLVGRQTELGDVMGALTTEPGKRIVVISAPAGVGKSRLALEALRRVMAQTDVRPQVLVRVESRVLDDDAFGRLPPGALILLVEDVHRDVDGLAAVLQFARRRSDVRVIVTTRGSDAPVLAAAVQAHFDSTEVISLKLGSLSASDARRLVQELQSDDVQLTAAGAESLAQAARYAPLVAVLAVSMIRAGELTVALTLHPDIRRHVMSTYGQVTTGGLPDVPPERARNTIAVIAALGTIDLEDSAEVDTVAAFLHVDRSVLLTDLGQLIEAGTVIRRKKHVRVVPDVLGDEVLASRAVAAGTDTGFVSKLWRAFGATRVEDLVQSIAELDWRLAALAELDGSAPSPELFSLIWAQVRPAVVASGNAGRSAALSRLRSVATLEPRRIFDLVRELIASPVLTPERSRFAEYTNADVRRAAAPLLQNCGAASNELLPDVLDMLWELAQLDSRPPNQDSDHPVRLLEDFATLGSNDAATIRACLEAVKRWLASPDQPGAPRTPIFLLKPMVAKSGYTMDPGHLSIEMHPYHISPDKVRDLRDQIRSLLGRVASCEPLRRAVDAVDILCDALGEPVGYFGQSVPESVTLAWEEDDLATLGALQRIADAATEPLIRLRMRSQLDWLARYARSPLLRKEGVTLAISVDNHLEDLFTDVLRGGWSTMTPRGARAGISQLPPFAPSDVDPPDPSQDWDIDLAVVEHDLELRDRCRQAEISFVVTNLAGRTLAEALDRVAERVSILHQGASLDEPLGVEEVIRRLCATKPDEIVAALGSLINSEASVLDPWVRVMADTLADADADTFVGVLTELMGSRTELAVAVLTGFAWHRWAIRVPKAGPVLVDALHHPDPRVQGAAWAAAGDLLEVDLVTWAPRLAEAAPEHPDEVGAAVASAGRRLGPQHVSELSIAEQSALLALLAALPNWRHPAHQLLAAIAAELPGEVLRLLSHRRLSASEQVTGIPGLAQALSRYPQEVRTWVQQSTMESEERRFELQALWVLIAGRPLTEGARSVLMDVAANGTEAELDLITGGIADDDGFAVREVELTSWLIDHIITRSEPLRDRALTRLRASINPTSYSRRPGHPSEDREKRRDKAQSAADDQSLSEAARAFFAEAAMTQQRLIEADLRRDADEDD